MGGVAMRRARFKADDAGQRGVAAIEFALLLPILVLFTFGIVEFGRAFNAQVTVTHAAREGARALIVGDDPAAAAAATVPGWMSGDGSWGVAADSCTSANRGDPVSVTVSYSFNYNIPLFNVGAFDFSETATMRCGGP